MSYVNMYGVAVIIIWVIGVAKLIFQSLDNTICVNRFVQSNSNVFSWYIPVSSQISAKISFLKRLAYPCSFRAYQSCARSDIKIRKRFEKIRTIHKFKTDFSQHQILQKYIVFSLTFDTLCYRILQNYCKTQLPFRIHATGSLLNRIRNP